MPKTKMPASVRKLPDKRYDQWIAVYEKSREAGDSKEVSAKKAWGALRRSESINYSLSKILESHDKDECGCPFEAFEESIKFEQARPDLERITKQLVVDVQTLQQIAKELNKKIFEGKEFQNLWDLFEEQLDRVTMLHAMLMK